MSDFNKIRYRAVIEFLTLENVHPQQIHNRMIVVYDENAPSYATVKRWAAEFRRGRTSLGDDSRSGRPSDAVCEENYCQISSNYTPKTDLLLLTGLSTPLPVVF